MKLKYIIPPDDFSLYHRELVLESIEWAIISSTAYLHIKIEYGNYDSVNDIFQPLNLKQLSSYKLVLIIDNTTLVNPLTGGLVADGENEEDCTLGEYDFFVSSLNKVPLATLLELGINRTIARGRHNV